jgi:esterase/lipase superfamily enzyme
MMRRRVWLTAVLLLALAAAGAVHAQERGALSFKPVDSEQPLRLYSRSVALVIGIDDYSNGWRPLRNAVKDAEAVEVALKEIGFEVRLETTAQLEPDPAVRDGQRKKVLTGGRIFQIVREFLYQVGHDPEARIFIWFAGHGESVKPAWAGARSTGYLIGADAPNPSAVPAARRAEAEAQMKERSVSLAQLGVLFDEIPAKHIMGVFDSCFAGTIFSGLRDGGPPPTIRRSVANPTRLFFTSGSEGQTVRDDGRFRALFVEAILGRIRADRNGDGYLTGKELGLFLQQEMADRLRSDHTPQFGPMHGQAASEGDFVFTISAEALAKLKVEPERPPGEVLHERFWGFVREEQNPPLIDRYVAAFPETPYRETAIAHARRLREPVVAAVPGPGPLAEATKSGQLWWRKPGDAAPQPSEWYEVPILFGTDRKAASGSYSGDRDKRLQLGGLLVTVPNLHQAGQIERPTSFNPFGVNVFRGQNDPKRHFTTRPAEAMTTAAFQAAIGSTRGRAKTFPDQGLLYVHGYNTGFEEAAFRAAQIGFDLGFDGPIFLYSWPSGSSVASYIYDRESAQASEPHLRDFLARLIAPTGVKRLHVVSHGMGGHVMMSALADLARRPPEPPVKLGQLVFAAPDSDRDAFEHMCRLAAGLAEGITIYASANDRSLEVARRISGDVPRAGEVPAKGPLINACARTIDVTALNTEAISLNHSTFASRRALLADTKSTLERGTVPPDQRNPAARRIDTPAGPYWRLSE